MYELQNKLIKRPYKYFLQNYNLLTFTLLSKKEINNNNLTGSYWLFLSAVKTSSWVMTLFLSAHICTMLPHSGFVDSMERLPRGSLD